MKQEIEFIKFNPTQNMTILVQTNHPAESYPHIASQLMSYEHVYAEQVGFIERSHATGSRCTFTDGGRGVLWQCLYGTRCTYRSRSKAGTT
ncbi:hypothetical protein AB9M62_11345 [Bacillales bacterium AN1005]